jgi:hypothetical protein
MAAVALYLNPIPSLWLACSLDQTGGGIRWNIIVKCVEEDAKQYAIEAG